METSSLMMFHTDTTTEYGSDLQGYMMFVSFESSLHLQPLKTGEVSKQLPGLCEVLLLKKERRFQISP